MARYNYRLDRRALLWDYQRQKIVIKGTLIDD